MNLEAQTKDLQELDDQLEKEDWVAGGFVWKWFHLHDRAGGEQNNRFTPQNKPAARLLKELYGH